MLLLSLGASRRHCYFDLFCVTLSVYAQRCRGRVSVCAHVALAEEVSVNMCVSSSSVIPFVFPTGPIIGLAVELTPSIVALENLFFLL